MLTGNMLKKMYTVLRTCEENEPCLSALKCHLMKKCTCHWI